MRRTPDDDPNRLTPAEVEAELHRLCGNADFARAKSLARAQAAGRHDLMPDDLLHEAFVAFLSGERRWPRGEHPLVVLKTAMRSIASNSWKRTKTGPIDHHMRVDTERYEHDDELARVVIPTEETTPLFVVDSKNQLEAIQNVVAGDEEAQLVVEAWADQLRGKEAAAALGFDMNAYEAARKRLMRRLEPIASLRRES